MDIHSILQQLGERLRASALSYDGWRMCEKK
jgi:hypothetical protein